MPDTRDPQRLSDALRKLADRVRLCAQISGGDTVPASIPPEPDPESVAKFLEISGELDGLSNLALAGDIPDAKAVERLVQRAQELNCAISPAEARAVLRQLDD